MAGPAALGLVLVTAVWGSTFVMIKGVVDDLPVNDFLAARFVLAAAVMLALFGRHVRALDRSQLRTALLLGAVYGLAQILQTQGLAITPAAVTGFITGIYVVLTPILAGLLLRQRTPPSTWVAVVLATAGLALLALRGLSVGTGELLTLASAVLYAAHIVGLGRWSSAGDALGLATVQMVAIAAVCSLAAVPDGVRLPSGAGAWWAVVYTAVVAGAFALVVQTWAQAHLTATRAAIIMTLEPVFAAAFAVALGGERLTWRTLAGGLLVLAAMYVAELGPGGRPTGGAEPGGSLLATPDDEVVTGT
ncbi:MAG TPA: DMT family transporter [Actinomycetales bacterium]|jgi:drug/metabolite transporter (DMT)-like permease